MPRANMTPGDCELLTADGMTSNTKAEQSMTRRRRLGEALRDNLRRRKAQARGRANEGTKPAADESEAGEIHSEVEVDR
jgi:hypothetical protein